MPIVGSADDVALSGWDDAPADGPAFALGDAEADADIRFSARGNVVQRGAQEWRRAPWPVRDALFDLPPAADPNAVLVVAPEADRIATGLRERGATATTAPRLTLEALQEAAVVVLIEDPFPRVAFAVLAARRVLVTTEGEATFGLQSGIEFLGAPAPSEAIERANLARLHPRAMHSLRVMGARAAREHRASLVYPRLAADLPSVA